MPPGVTTRQLKWGLAFVSALIIVAAAQSTLFHRPGSDCSLDDFGAAAFSAWDSNGKLPQSKCYQIIFRQQSDFDVSLQAAEAFERHLADHYPRMGYKIGLHQPDIQQRVGIPSAMFGVFYGEGFFENGSTVAIDGQALNYEPDMLLRVSDARIMEAQTIEDALRHLDRAYAFIELPVLLTDPEEVRDGFPYSFLMQALNLGARYGVIGEHLDLQNDPNIVTKLRNMTVVSSNSDGTQRSIYNMAEREDVHFLIVVLDTIQHLKRRGEALQAGDLISVGAMGTNFIDLAEPTDGKRHVHYYIGDQVISVSAGFK